MIEHVVRSWLLDPEEPDGRRRFHSDGAGTSYMAHPLHQAVVDLAGELTSRVEAFSVDVRPSSLTAGVPS
jgi:hypothetical protein